MPVLGCAGVIKKFVGEGCETVSMPEMKEFLAATDKDERVQMADDAAKIMGWSKTADGKYDVS